VLAEPRGHVLSGGRQGLTVAVVAACGVRRRPARSHPRARGSTARPAAGSPALPPRPARPREGRRAPLCAPEKARPARREVAADSVWCSLRLGGRERGTEAAEARP
jgi:hypothetical protein